MDPTQLILVTAVTITAIFIVAFTAYALINRSRRSISAKEAETRFERYDYTVACYDKVFKETAQAFAAQLEELASERAKINACTLELKQSVNELIDVSERSVDAILKAVNTSAKTDTSGWQEVDKTLKEMRVIVGDIAGFKHTKMPGLLMPGSTVGSDIGTPEVETVTGPLTIYDIKNQETPIKLAYMYGAPYKRTTTTAPTSKEAEAIYEQIETRMAERLDSENTTTNRLDGTDEYMRASLKAAFKAAYKANAAGRDGFSKMLDFALKDAVKEGLMSCVGKEALMLIPERQRAWDSLIKDMGPLTENHYSLNFKFFRDDVVIAATDVSYGSPEPLHFNLYIYARPYVVDSRLVEFRGDAVYITGFKLRSCKKRVVFANNSVYYDLAHLTK